MARVQVLINPVALSDRTWAPNSCPSLIRQQLICRRFHPHAPVSRPGEVFADTLFMDHARFLKRLFRGADHPVLGVGEQHRRHGRVVHGGVVSIAPMATDNAGGRHLRLGVRHPGQLDGGGAVAHGKNVSVRRNHSSR